MKEAINIDTPDKETNGFNNIWSKHDKTPNENVTISGCQFTNLGRAIGTHKYSASGDTQIYHRNIQILNCKISNMRWDSPIRVMNWKDSAIQNTVIQNVKQPGKAIHGCVSKRCCEFYHGGKYIYRNGASGAVYCLEK